MGKSAKKKKIPGSKLPVQENPPVVHKGYFPNRVWYLLSGIFILGLFLRFFELARKPLWLDEASTNYLTTQPDLTAVITAASSDHHAPLHFVAIWLIKSIGSSEFLLRLPSVIAGALTVLVIFFIANELYNEQAGLIAAALLALSPFHILYSQEARMYGMVVLFVSLAVFLFLRASRTRSTPDWLLFGCACAASFYTHFYTAFAIIALFCAYFIMRFREFRPRTSSGGTGFLPVQLPADFRNFVAGIALSLVLVLPILGSFFNQSGYFVSRTFNWGLSMWSIPSETFLDFSYFYEFIAILFVCLMLIGFAMIWTRQKEQMAAVAVILFVPIIISLYLSQIIPFNVRYHLYLIVVFLSLVALPLAWLAKRVHPQHGTIAVVGLILLLSALPLHTYYTEPLQEDWRSFSANLRLVTEPGDIIAPLPWYMYLPLSYYYDNSSDGTYYRNFALNETGFRSLDNSTGSVFFVVTWDINAADPTGYSVQYLNQHTTQQQGSVPGIYLLKKIS